MKSKLAAEKHADSMMSLASNMALGGIVAPFTWLFDVPGMQPWQTMVLRFIPLLLVGVSIWLWVSGLRLYDQISQWPKEE